MRTPQQLVHARTKVTSHYALMPLEGFPLSRLPASPETELRVLASPALGARFVQMLADIPAGKSFQLDAQAGVEVFYFVVWGLGNLLSADSTVPIEPGSFGLLQPGAKLHVNAREPIRLLLLQKRYEPAEGVEIFNAIHGRESEIPRKVWADNPHSLLQTLIPDDVSFDLAMNIFTFDPGYGLPIVETHVMEHGLLFLQGKGLYYLGDQWIEVEKDDFIWMGAYCPQSFYATGPTPSRYIYYKNVNRDILA